MQFKAPTYSKTRSAEGVLANALGVALTVGAMIAYICGISLLAVAIIGMAAIVLAISLAIVAIPPAFATVLFFCFDDAMASLTGVSTLGTIPVGSAFAFMCLAYIFLCLFVAIVRS